MHQFHRPMNQLQVVLMHCETDAYTARQPITSPPLGPPSPKITPLSCNAYKHPIVLLEGIYEFFIIRDGATWIVNDKQNPRPLI